MRKKERMKEKNREKERKEKKKSCLKGINVGLQDLLVGCPFFMACQPFAGKLMREHIFRL